MVNQRREDKRKDLGLASEKERKKIEKDVLSAQKEVDRHAKRREEIESHSLYRFVIKGAFFFDVIDGLSGLAEFVGDAFSSIFHLVNLYLSVFVVKSIRLSFAVLVISLIDLLIGLIPVAGSILDFVFCSSIINRQLIRGWVENDPSTRSKVNKIVTIGTFVVAGLLGIVWYLISRA